MIRVELDKNKKKADDKAKITFVQEKFDDIFKEYIENRQLGETSEENQ